MQSEFDVQTSMAVAIRSKEDSMAQPPGTVRDAILAYLHEAKDQQASMSDILAAVVENLGNVSPSSVRSYLNLNPREVLERPGRGRYRLKKKLKADSETVK